MTPSTHFDTRWYACIYPLILARSQNWGSDRFWGCAPTNYLLSLSEVLNSWIYNVWIYARAAPSENLILPSYKWVMLDATSRASSATGWQPRLALVNPWKIWILWKVQYYLSIGSSMFFWTMSWMNFLTNLGKRCFTIFFGTIFPT